jgi:hypothetical protein
VATYTSDEDDKQEKKSSKAPLTRKGEGMMDTDDISAAIGPVLADCVAFADTVLTPERVMAAKYYDGEPFGNEEEGRSQIVLTVLRDTVSGIVPEVLRVAYGPERVVEFTPKSSDPQASLDAKHQTDYIHFCFTERNAGFLESLAVLKDGLIKNVGIFKTWWDDSSDVRAYTLRNVTDDELNSLAADDDVKLLGVTVTGVQKASDLPPAPPAPAPQPGQPPADAPQPQKLHTVHMTRSMPGRIKVKAVPPEEFLYNRTARDTDSQFVVLAHRMKKTKGELIALGIDEDVIDEFGAPADELDTNAEAIERRVDGINTQQDEAAGEANEEIEYTEGYWHLDVDGDDIAELRMICTIGPKHHVTNGDGLGEPVDDHPFSLFIPDPEPHTLHGSGMYERVGDIQLMSSSVFRAQADALSAALFPRIAYVENQANVQDILNVEIGAPIRMRAPGMVTPIAMPYSGEMADAMLNRLSDITEQRTGRRKGVEGLDGDALQSTTAQGVDAAVAGARSQTEMLARIFAEMTLKPMFRRMYRLAQQNQPEETVKLRDRMVTVNPSAWAPELDVVVNVALGSTLIEKKLTTIVATLAKQESVLQLLGPQNPIVSLSMYAATLQRGVELGGFKDVESFFMSVDPKWQPPQQAPQETPEQTMAKAQLQIEQMRVQKDLQIKQAELMLKQKSQQDDHVRGLAKDAADLALRKLQIEYQFHAGDIQNEFENNVTLDERMMDAHRMNTEHAMQAQQQVHDQALAQQSQLHDQHLAQNQQAHEQQLAEQQASQQTQGASE